MNDTEGLNPNPYFYLKAAARGDLAAQRALAFLSLQSGDSVALLEGLCFARMAFANGEHPDDAGRLIQMLAAASDAHPRNEDAELREALHSESLALISYCADNGNNDCADALPGMVEAAPTHVVRDSRNHLLAMQEMGA